MLPYRRCMLAPVDLPEGLRPGGRFAEWSAIPPRYLVADVDGTLLGEAHRLTAAVREAVRACAPAGLRLGLATGRMPSAVRELVHEVGAGGPHVVHNGAEVWADGEVLAAWPLPRDAAVLLQDLAHERGLYAEFYLDDGYAVTDRRESAQRHWTLLGRGPDADAAELDLAAVEVVKATVLLFDDDDPEPVLAALSAAGLTCGAAKAPALPDVTFLNVTHPDADKGRALAVAADRLGLGMPQVAAVGDGLNDVSMLRVAGTAMAMGQAPDEVVRVAHLVVPEFDADGVAHALTAAASWCASRVVASADG
jgi:Cof subfamily protein (haloacid dehalogenase superfamily)